MRIVILLLLLAGSGLAVRLRTPSTLSPTISAAVVRGVEQSTELSSAWKTLLLYTPPFDTSVIAKAYLTRRFSVLLRQHQGSACAAYGQAAVDTILFMVRHEVPYAMARPTSPTTQLAAEYEARCTGGSGDSPLLPYVAERHFNFINLLPSQLVRDD
jgi:hypothetical protein